MLDPRLLIAIKKTPGVDPDDDPAVDRKRSLILGVAVGVAILIVFFMFFGR